MLVVEKKKKKRFQLTGAVDGAPHGLERVRSHLNSHISQLQKYKQLSTSVAESYFEGRRIAQTKIAQTSTQNVGNIGKRVPFVLRMYSRSLCLAREYYEIGHSLNKRALSGWVRDPASD